MKRTSAILAAALLLLSLTACGGKTEPSPVPEDAAPPAAETEPADAEAEAESPAAPGYISIRTPEDFLRIADDLDGKYILDDDIDDWRGGESTVFTPIGTPEQPFTGELNGNGHTITGTLAYTGGEEAWGLFGCSEGYIHDLTVGYVYNRELNDRYYDYQVDDRTYSSVDEEGLPAESTLYYGVLCGLNRGTIENVVLKGSTPEMNLLLNGNEHICVGLLCGRNEGVISGITGQTSMTFRSLDKDTAAAVGAVCGYQTADAVLEDVTLTGVGVRLDSWGYTNHLSPAVYAGLLIGEAEGGTTIRGAIDLRDNLRVSADYSLADQNLLLGGLVGLVRGDLALSDVHIDDLYVRIDARTDQDGYSPAEGAPPLACGGLIGWADGSVTLADIAMTEVQTDVIRRSGGSPLPSYAGGCVARCGGSLTARGVTLAGDRSNVDAQPEEGDAYGAGLCGYCGGSAEVEDCLFSLVLSPWFRGDALYGSNVLGRVCGDAVFRGVRADCGLEEYTNESRSHSINISSGCTLYLASLAGCAEGEVTAEDCVIDVHYNVMGTPGALYSGGDEGLYNRP